MSLVVQTKYLNPWTGGQIPSDAILAMELADGTPYKITADQISASSDTFIPIDSPSMDTTVIIVTELIGKTLKAFFRAGFLVNKIILYPTTPTDIQIQFNPANGQIAVTSEFIFKKDEPLNAIYSA